MRIAPWKPAPNPAPASAATKEEEWLVERSHRDEGAADAVSSAVPPMSMAVRAGAL